MTDRELLFLYGLISCKNPRTIVEIGGGKSTHLSTKIFLDVIKGNPDQHLYSIDILEIEKIQDNHYTIQKSCSDVISQDFSFRKIDILFLDAHVVIPQLDFFNRMVDNKSITDDTIIILHDTNLFYKPFVDDNFLEGSFEHNDGFVHQWVERNLVNYFKLKGYDLFNLNTKKENHNFDYPYLYGFSICQKFKPFTPFYVDYKK